eukprot:scaffold1830_cov115-Skeletonema_marinoi.AAC.6
MLYRDWSGRRVDSSLLLANSLCVWPWVGTVWQAKISSSGFMCQVTILSFPASVTLFMTRVGVRSCRAFMRATRHRLYIT